MKLIVKDGTEFEVSSVTRDVFKKGGDVPCLLYIAMDDPVVTADELMEKLTAKNLSEVTVEADAGVMKRYGCTLNDLNEYLTDTHSGIRINLTVGRTTVQ